MAMIRLMVLAATGAAILGGCGGASKTASPGDAQPMAKAAESDFYGEESYKGRTYVFGTEKAHKKFRASEELPGITATFVAAGDSRETVVLEADAKNPALQERLKAEFNRRHSSKLP